MSSQTTGAWGRPHSLTQAVSAVEQQRIDGAARATQAARAETARVAQIGREAQALADAVQGCIDGGAPGYSSNYPNDAQYTVARAYASTVVVRAYALWRDSHSAPDRVALRPHMMGPSQKFTGGRGGAKQANFIRLAAPGSSKRHNVHINVND